MKKLLFLLLLPCLSSFTEKNKQYQTEDFRMDIVLSTGEYYNLTSEQNIDLQLCNIIYSQNNSPSGENS